MGLEPGKKNSKNFIVLFPVCLVHLTIFAKLYNNVIGQYQWNHDKNCLIMQINIQRGLKTSMYKAKMVLFKSSFDVDTHNYTGFFLLFFIISLLIVCTYIYWIFLDLPKVPLLVNLYCFICHLAVKWLSPSLCHPILHYPSLFKCY